MILALIIVIIIFSAINVIGQVANLLVLKANNGLSKRYVRNTVLAVVTLVLWVGVYLLYVS